MSFLNTALIIGAVTAVAGGVTSAVGSYQQGQAQKKMNQYSAEVAAQQTMLTQRTADTNITLVQGQAAEASKQERRNLAMLEGEQKGILAAQGVGGGSVSAADIASSTFNTAELDRQAIRYNADSKAWGIRNNADFETWNLGNQKNQFLMAGKNAATAGTINAGASLLNTASSVANSYAMNKYYATSSRQSSK